MCVSEKNSHKCLIESFLLNCEKISLFLKSIDGGVGNKKFFDTEMVLFPGK